MSTTAPSPEESPSGATPMILTRVARTHIDALGHDDAPLQLLIVGTAGSGKTRLLRRLCGRFTERGRTVLAGGPHTVIADVPADTVLFLDDAHLLDDDAVAQAATRVRTPGAGLILAMRPWPASESLRRLATELEHAQPPIVLGHVARADVLDQLELDGRTVDERCIDSILDLTGHLTWLVSEALSIHHDDCDDTAAHPAIREELRDLIAHRIARLDDDVRGVVQSVCLSPTGGGGPELALGRLAGHAKGLLQRNGQPAPVVRETVRATTSVERLWELYATSGGREVAPSPDELAGGARNERLAAALLADGDATLALDPVRAEELFRAAAEAGADRGAVAVRRAAAAWTLGAVDATGALLDAAASAPTSPADARAATALAAAVWAARGDLAMSAAVLAHADDDTPAAVAHGTIAATGAADLGLLDRLSTLPAARTAPSALVVSHQLLTRGLGSTLTTDTRTCLSDLIRSSEMYTAARTSAPTPELPAVLATVVALSLGEIAAAHSVIETAVRERHGGAWALPRLLLWQAWVAVQRERPHEAEAALEKARANRALPPRERVLADAIAVALTRRYADPSALAPVWRVARESILRTRFDLFSLLPLGEFAVSAARLGDLDRIRPHLDEAYDAVERLGSPPLWSAPLHWAGLHCSILQNQPAELAPHAHALLAAAPHVRLAKMMAAAGRVWTEVLTGKVDVDAIEKAALGLASVGLAWDGARLAGQGAARSDDRRVIGRLLACARQLHPREELVEQHPDETGTDTGPISRPNDMLSAREREVAALVLEGKTYAEIGESIFISPRTAEHHIARIRRRLGATSRSDLIAKLRMVLDDTAGAASVVRGDFA